jgi:hypothetical protein
LDINVNTKKRLLGAGKVVGLEINTAYCIAAAEWNFVNWGYRFGLLTI